MAVIWSLLLMLLTTTSTDCSAALMQRTTFWVAPSIEECQAKSPCSTLAGYQEDSINIFSTSHATWVFLKGYHRMLPTPIVVSGAENVTWTGETGCTPYECRIIQPSYNGTLNHSMPYCSYVVFEDCHGVNVHYLGFISLEATTQFPSPCQQMKLSGVEDAVLHSVLLEGWHGLGVFNASGRYELVNLVTEKSEHFIELDFCSPYSRNCSFSLNMTNVTLKSSEMFLTVGKYANTEYSSISILLDNCTFTGSRHAALVLNVWSYPSDSLVIKVRNSVFKENIYGVQLHMVLTVQNWSLVGVPQYRPLILLDGVSVSNTSHGVHISLIYKFPDNNSCNVQHPEIIISNSSFFDSRKSCKDADIYMVHATLQPNNSSVANYELCRTKFSLPNSYPSTVLRFQGSKFHSNHVSAVVHLGGFSWHRAAFDGGNEISNNHAIGLVLNDTQLEIHGYNDIHENDDGGLYMTSDSLLLMANGSVLNVSHNSAEFGGGIHISYKGRSIASYQDFLHCYVYKTTCPGWCFFQFVDQNGHLLKQNELDAYEANLNLENNRASKDGNEIFNGHLHNCSLMTKDGVIGASMDTLLLVLPSSVLQDDALDSLPYYMCLCNTSNPNDILMNCHHNLTLTYFPGDTSFAIDVLKDLNRFSFRTLVVKDGELERKVVTYSKCTTVYTMGHNNPGEQHSLHLQATGPGQGSDYVLHKFIFIIERDCPTGMRKINNSCTCNSVLADHGFQCSGPWYKSVTQETWIGMENGRLVIGDNCIRCNSSVLANGIPSDSVNLSSSSQCSSEYGREGLMCSQCPENQQPEYFARKCRECPYEWIALLLILFIGGPLVVGVLFLFNLTLMQGTINGLLLYCFLMIHKYSEVFSLYAWKPLYIVFRLLNLSFGHGLCFFNEFSKGLLHFAFPSYLLTLMATIIICAHKCNLRIFRITFIARRAVPVLTTLMIMTFVSLLEAIIIVLHHHNIYDVLTGDRKTVYLFDSSLPYFRGKHLVLALIAIICSIVYLCPLIVVILFGDLLRRCTRSIWLSHFIDVFHGAYRYPFGFWLGVRLLTRVVLSFTYMVFQTAFGDTLATFVAILCICLFQLYFKPFRTLEDHLATSQYSPSSCRLLSGHSRLEGILIKLQPSTLDLAYLLNALITSAAIIYSTVEGANEIVLKIAANVSLIVALLQFLAILCYHTYRFFPLPKPVRMCLKSCYSHFTKGGRRKRQQTVCDITPTFDDTAAHAEPVMTIRLHPPLEYDHDNSYDSDESSTTSNNDRDDLAAAVHTVTEVADISPGLTEPLLHTEPTSSL